MVDCVLLLVDAAEGPLPQTRYVLQKAMARRLPVVVALNKIDRSDARAGRGPRRRSTSCSSTSAPTSTRSSSRSSTRTPRPARRPATSPCPGTDLRPLLDLLVEVTPPPAYEPDHPLQLLVTNLIGERVRRAAWPSGGSATGRSAIGQRIAVVREEADDTAGAIEPGRTVTLTGAVTSLQTAHGMERVDIAEAGPGEIVSVAGLPEVTIGDTLTDPATRARCRASTSTRRRCG